MRRVIISYRPMLPAQTRFPRSTSRNSKLHDSTTLEVRSGADIDSVTQIVDGAVVGDQMAVRHSIPCFVDRSDIKCIRRET